MRKPFIAKDHIEELNKLRLENSDVLMSESILKSNLRRIGIPQNANFLVALKKYHIIVKVGDYYSFSSSNPIHYTILNNLYKDYQRKVNKNRQKNILDKKVKEAIDFLKLQGYSVYKKC